MAELSQKKLYKRRKRKKIRRAALVTGLSLLGMLGLYQVFSSSQNCASKCPYSSAVEEAAVPVMESACEDSVTGTWTGEQYLHGDRYQFTVNVQRKAPGSNELVGTITSHYWSDAAGTTNVNDPPACACDGSVDRVIVDMNASGVINGNTVTFSGDDWKLREVACGSFSGGYLPDSFTGTLQGNEEFVSTNDDGGNPATNVTFQRVRCETGASVSPL